MITHDKPIKCFPCLNRYALICQKYICYFHRWETVANFIKQHIPASKKIAKEVLAKAKDLQRLGLYFVHKH